MSKRIRSSRLAKKGRRLRPAGERGSSMPEARDALSSAIDGEEQLDADPRDSEQRDSGEVLSARASGAAPGPGPEPAPQAPPAPVGREESPSSTAVTVPITVKAVAAEVAARSSAAPDSKGGDLKKKKKRKKAEPGAIPSAPIPSVGAAPRIIKEPDPRSDSGAMSLNEPLARGFYESMPPASAHLDHEDEVEAARPVALSPAQLERKAKLRRIVGGICAAAALVVLLVAGKTLVERGTASVPSSSSSAVVLSPPAEKVPAEKAAEEPRADGPGPAVDARKAAEDAAASEEARKAEEAKAKAEEEKKAEEAKAAATRTKEEIAELKKSASKLYNHGKLKEAIPALREVIAADPDDALPYLYLGDALTNTGKWPEAREAYNQCVRTATKGPKYECSAMGGRK